jgi:triacylglycerol lipase
MTLLGRTEPGQGERTPAQRAPFDLRLEEAVAIGSRLWIRGRLTPEFLSPNIRLHSQSETHRNGDSSTLSIVVIETRLGGRVFHSEAPVTSTGEFEALLADVSPLPRRGWRIARNRVTVFDQTTEQCTIVLSPPEHTAIATIVLLPLNWCLRPGGLQGAANSAEAQALAPVLQALYNDPKKPSVIYYLASSRIGHCVKQAELALAAAALGWPGAAFVIMESESGRLQEGLAKGLDRLRWLAAGTLDTQILNLDTSLESSVASWSAPAQDRANVLSTAHAGRNPWSLLQGPNRAPVHRSLVVPRATRSYLVPKHPVVFCHGMLAFSTLNLQRPIDTNCFSSLREFFGPRGYRVLYPQVAPTSGIVSRAHQLCDQIRRWTEEPVNLVAHSMGGLDARYAISRLGLGQQVCSLTTIATPHRGTALVDWFIRNYRNRVPLLLALEAVGMNVDGFADCRPKTCAEFNAQTPDLPGIRYFSYGGSVTIGHVTPVLRRAWCLLSAVEGPNDGMVSLASSRWGEYLGTIHADHFAQTPDMTFVHPNETFDALGFYSRLLEDLARRGF